MGSPSEKVSGLGFQDLGFKTSVSGPGFQDTDRRTQRILRLSHIFPVIFLCVHRHFSFSRHVVCASSGHRQIVSSGHIRTDNIILYINSLRSCVRLRWQFCILIRWQNHVRSTTFWQPFLWRNRPQRPWPLATSDPSPETQVLRPKCNNLFIQLPSPPKWPELLIQS
jgi:hypothetical protein